MSSEHADERAYVIPINTHWGESDEPEYDAVKLKTGAATFADATWKPRHHMRTAFLSLIGNLRSYKDGRIAVSDIDELLEERASDIEELNEEAEYNEALKTSAVIGYVRKFFDLYHKILLRKQEHSDQRDVA